MTANSLTHSLTHSLTLKAQRRKLQKLCNQSNNGNEEAESRQEKKDTRNYKAGT
jgi:hypothetical protein